MGPLAWIAGLALLLAGAYAAGHVAVEDGRKSFNRAVLLALVCVPLLVLGALLWRAA